MEQKAITATGRYRNFCVNAPADFPLFMQDWYLDAVCTRGTWEAAVVEKGGKIAGVMPCFIKKSGLWHYVTMPVLGRFMGPYILPEFRNSHRETEIVESLIGQLPKLVTFTQDFNYTVTNWLPFYWQNFRQSTRYSYVLHVENLEQVWNGIAADYRNHKIRKAKAFLQIETDGNLQELFRLNNLGYTRQRLPIPFNFSFLQNLDQILAQKKQRKIFVVRNPKTGAIHSAAYLVWDQSAAYYLIAGDDPALRNAGSGILMAWECIRYTAEVLRLPCFDFVGSMIRPVERVRRQFGAVQQPYFRVEKESSLFWKMAKRLKT